MILKQSSEEELSFSDLNYFPPQYPEFWQEIVEKDYEILSFYSDTKSLAFPQRDGLFACSPLNSLNKGFYTAQEMLSMTFNKFTIKSIKRLSDGEIFTIGDKLHITFNKPNIIKELISFEITDHLYLKLKDSLGTVITTMNNLEKPKTPLFTTEDGVDIFESDDIYEVTSLQLFPTKWRSYYGNNGKPLIGKIYFSNKEKAEEYILMNKPCLSYGEVQEYLKVKDCNKVLDLAQSKIQQSV